MARSGGCTRWDRLPAPARPSSLRKTNSFFCDNSPQKKEFVLRRTSGAEEGEGKGVDRRGVDAAALGAPAVDGVPAPAAAAVGVLPLMREQRPAGRTVP